MTRQTIQDKLFALYRVSSEQLTDFLQGGNFDRYGIKANEFDVFCAFWTTACYLRSTATPAAREVENFNKSIVVTIVDRIIAASPEELSAEQLEALSQTVTDVFVERFSGYRDFFQADLQQRENESIRLFPRLVEGFLGSVLDAPVADHSPVRQLFDGILADMLNRAVIFFAGATGDAGHGRQDEGREGKGKIA
ncbi:MAG: hypothetical protein HY789_16030 [Deltaproteobacteria bacterium]|nr:hypothetical protein [Deltaproteobacteria bacterium]